MTEILIAEGDPHLVESIVQTDEKLPPLAKHEIPVQQILPAAVAQFEIAALPEKAGIPGCCFHGKITQLAIFGFAKIDLVDLNDLIGG